MLGCTENRENTLAAEPSLFQRPGRGMVLHITRCPNAGNPRLSKSPIDNYGDRFRHVTAPPVRTCEKKAEIESTILCPRPDRSKQLSGVVREKQPAKLLLLFPGRQEAINNRTRFGDVCVWAPGQIASHCRVLRICPKHQRRVRRRGLRSNIRAARISSGAAITTAI